ncbi:Nephrin [Nymphon striatum]|nr:Nephrin [Nymphon striatum]
MKSTVRLSVLYPPGPPEIQGYQEGEVVRMGDTLALSCISRGGNPLAALVWFKNNEQVDHSFTTRGKQSLNVLSFVVGAADNNAIFRCDASNKETTEAMSVAVKLTVHFSPGKAVIDGPKEASAGDVITMFCKTERSNPPADISWVIDGRRTPSTDSVKADPQGGWITSSNITCDSYGV